MSSRLGFFGAYNRQRTLSPIQTDEAGSKIETSSSAAVSKLTRDYKALKEKHRQTKHELDETRLALKQIISESSHEKFDERRINLIKFQLVQLERQIGMMSDALGFKTESVMEAENSLVWLADKFRSYLAAETKGPMLSISRSDITALIETAESARIKLFKGVEKCTKKDVGKDLLLLNPFLKSRNLPQEPLSLLDVSLDCFRHLNLQHVSLLESKLSSLYKELIGLHEQLQVTGHGRLSQAQASSAELARLESSLLKCCVHLKDAADDLLALSLLCPSAPWPALRRPVCREVPVERAVSSLPPLPQTKQEEVIAVLTKSIQTCNHRYHLLEKEKAALKEELIFHRTVYQFQLEYTQQLFDCVRKGYVEFEDSMRSVVCKPLKDLLKTFSNLKKTSSEKSLRELLLRLKETESQLSKIVTTFDKEGDQGLSSGEGTLTSMEVDFISNLDLLVEQCQKHRDSIMRDKKKLRKEQEKQNQELLQLIENLEAKYQKQWTPNKSMDFVSEDSILTEIDAGTVDNKTTSRSKKPMTSRVEDGKPFNSSRTCPESDSMVGIVKGDKDSSANTARSNENSFVLRGYLDEDSSWVSDFTPVGEQSGANDIESKPNNLNYFSTSAGQEAQLQDNVRPKKKKASKWMPSKEWVNDFSSSNALEPHSTDKPAKTEGEVASLGDKDILGTLGSHSKPKNEGGGSQKSSVSRGRRVRAQAKNYSPNLAVAQQSLVLKKGSLRNAISLSLSEKAGSGPGMLPSDSECSDER